MATNDHQILWQSAGGKALDHWEFFTIEELLENPKSISVGVMYPGKDTPGGVPLIKISDIKDGFIDSKPTFCISLEVDEEYKRTRLNGTELLITLVGNPGDCVVVNESMVGWNAARAIAVVRLAHPDLRAWLRYILLSRPVKHLIDARLNTTVQKTLNLKDIRQLPLPIPSKKERDVILDIISKLDDKIELNRQMNATLEGMAQALFKSWFVDFDPVIDNALAAGNPIPEAFDARAEIRRKALADGTANRDVAKQFPAAFQFTEEMGWIPEGWEVKEIREHTKTIQYGLTQSASDEECGPKFLRITDIRGGRIEWDQVPFCEVSSNQFEKYKINQGDIFVARTGASTGENVYVINGVNSVFASYLVRLTFDDRAIGRIVAMFMRSSRYFEYIDGIIGGSAQPNASAQALTAASMIFPSLDSSKLFFDKISLLDKRRAANENEVITLKRVRDTLLPKLISGEIRIPEAEKLTEEALA